jgi:uncharacterized membrane protein SirB2
LLFLPCKLNSTADEHVANVGDKFLFLTGIWRSLHIFSEASQNCASWSFLKLLFVSVILFSFRQVPLRECAVTKQVFSWFFIFCWPCILNYTVQ